MLFWKEKANNEINEVSDEKIEDESEKTTHRIFNVTESGLPVKQREQIFLGAGKKVVGSSILAGLEAGFGPTAGKKAGRFHEQIGKS